MVLNMEVSILLAGDAHRIFSMAPSAVDAKSRNGNDELITRPETP